MVLVYLLALLVTLLPVIRALLMCHHGDESWGISLMEVPYLSLCRLQGSLNPVST